MEFKDYYKTLGVARDATVPDIKKAFRKLARKYHPDVSKEPDAEARMQELNEAYAVLSDPEKRAAYDQLGRGHRPGEEFRPPPDWDAGYEFSGRGFSPSEEAAFSDFFSELFGHMGGARGRYHTGGAEFRARGEDHHAKVLLELEDAFEGATRQISLRVPRLDPEGRVVVDTRTLNVRIPKGVHEGQIIRLAGQGSPGIGGGSTGDLLLEVHFRPIGSLLDESWLTLEQIAAACTVEPRWLERHIEEGLFPHTECVAGTWRVTALHLRRARRMREIERVFDAEPELAALVADLLEQMDELHARLRRAGLE
jgi:DnaJ-class molecular chaperone